MNFDVALLVFGILLLLVGLVGKVKAKELEIGTSSRVARSLIGLVGVAMLALSFNPDLMRSLLSREAQTTPAKPSDETTPAKPSDETTPVKPSDETTPAKPSGETTPAKPSDETTPEVTSMRIKNPSSGLCLGSLEGSAKMQLCDGQSETQAWRYDQILNQIENLTSGLCLDSFGRAGSAMMYGCHGRGGNQEWHYDVPSGQLKNPSSGLCLDSFGKTGSAMMHPCHGKKGNQEWRISSR